MGQVKGVDGEGTVWIVGEDNDSSKVQNEPCIAGHT